MSVLTSEQIEAIKSRKAQLQHEAAEVEKQLRAISDQQKATVIKDIKELMAKHQIGLADLKGLHRGPKQGAKVAPKYRCQTSGQTWTGRGLQPGWIKTLLAAGGSLSDVEIKA